MGITYPVQQGIEGKDHLQVDQHLNQIKYHHLHIISLTK
jgi:hypothetical protein